MKFGILFSEIPVYSLEVNNYIYMVFIKIPGWMGTHSCLDLCNLMV